MPWQWDFSKTHYWVQSFGLEIPESRFSAIRRCRPDPKLIFFEKTLCHDIGNSKLHNVCKFQGKISRTSPFIVRKPGAAEGRIATMKTNTPSWNLPFLPQNKSLKKALPVKINKKKCHKMSVNNWIFIFSWK